MKNGHKSLKNKITSKMKKKPFFGQFDKIFFEERSLRSDEKKFLSKIAKKMIFYIFEVNLDFNDL